MRGRGGWVGVVVGALALGSVACGSSDGAPQVAGSEGETEVDCEALTRTLGDAEVGSFRALEGAPNPQPMTPDAIAASLDALPADLRSPLEDLPALIERGEALEAERDGGGASSRRLAEIRDELTSMRERYETSVVPAEAAAWEWAAERCADGRVLWACYEAIGQPRFRPVGMAIDAEGDPVAPPHGEPEDATDVDGWTEVFRDEVEVVYATLDDRGRAVAVRSVEEGTDGIQGWHQVYDLSCDEAVADARGGVDDDSSLEPIPGPMTSSTQVFEEVGP
jgi:hypothetical protein